MNKSERTTISVPGLAKTLNILHVTDTHFCRVDAEDSEHLERCRVRVAEWERIDCENRSTQVMRHAAGGRWDSVFLTGDIVDFPSRASLELAAGLMKACTAPLLYICGNHDWSFPRQAADADLRDKNLRRLAPLFAPGIPSLCHRVEVGGLQVLSVDNSTYQIRPEQLEFVRRHLGNGMPTVILMHIPMTLPGLREMTIAKWGVPILMGESLSEEIRLAWNVESPVAETNEFIELLGKATNLHGIFCGHEHLGHEGRFSDSAMQYVTMPAFEGGWREIEFGPTGA